METFVHDNDRAAYAGTCPSDETLAVWFEGKLSAADAAELEAHIAGCERCAELVAAIAPVLDVEVAGAVHERLESDPPEPLAAFQPNPAFTHKAPRVRTWRPLLALAASVVVVLGGAAVWQMARQSDPIRDVQTLAALQGDRRQTHGRLHGFPWAEAPPTYRSGSTVGDSAGADLLEAAADIERKYQSSDDPDALYAYGVALLVAGELDAGIEKLGAAAAARPSDARILNDASVAYLQRAWVRSDPEALTEARRLAEAATRLQPDEPSGWFNLLRVAQLQDDAALVAKAGDALARLEPASSRWRAEASTP